MNKRKKFYIVLIAIGLMVLGPFAFLYTFEFSPSCGVFYIYPRVLVKTSGTRIDKEAMPECSHEYHFRVKRSSPIYPHTSQQYVSVEMYDKPMALKWYGSCYQQFAEIRERSVKEAFAWKDANCPDTEVFSLEDIEKLKGEPDDRYEKDDWSAILYGGPKSLEKQKSYVKFLGYELYAKTDNKLVRVYIMGIDTQNDRWLRARKIVETLKLF